MHEKHEPAVLIVDDNPSNLELLYEVLDDAGFEVLVSQNGEGALKRAEHSHPDLLLLDVMMPGMDGFETCQRLKAHAATKDIPVIFMTALADTDDKVKGFEAGAVDYVTKPFQPVEVLMRIKTHLTLRDLQHELRQKNLDLSAALEREKELNQLKSRFVSMVSHEFKTPLTTITLSCNLLERYSDRMPAEKRVEELHVIERTVDHLRELVEQVLTLSRADAGKLQIHLEALDVQAWCERLTEHFQALCEGTHTITLTFTGHTGTAVCDPTLLEHIFSNLLSNAIRYSPAGGNILFDCVRETDVWVWRVKDPGMGMSDVDQQHLFEPFHRGENVGTIKGTGLGLSIVKQCVELLGGAIRVESTLNQGTAFTVTLPITQGSIQK
jgi:two-component system, sensor histidine kinase and response regulator